MGDFALSVKKFVEKTKLKPQLVIKKVAFDMLSTIMQRSPVRTGRFRANWHVTIDAPDDWKTERTDKRGEKTLKKVEGLLEGADIFECIYILNNLEYAIPLEYGHSKQAPSGMVRITIKEFEQFLKDALKSLD